MGDDTNIQIPDKKDKEIKIIQDFLIYIRIDMKVKMNCNFIQKDYLVLVILNLLVLN